MRTSPLLADFIHARGCKPKCEKSLTLPFRKPCPFLFLRNLFYLTGKTLAAQGLQGFLNGGDCWTRTSDLLRVKIRQFAKTMMLGAFWYLRTRLSRDTSTALSLRPSAAYLILVRVLVKASSMLCGNGGCLRPQDNIYT